MNIETVNSILQLVAWFLALIEVILGLYVLLLNIRHTANWHLGVLLLIFAIDSYAIGAISLAKTIEEAATPAYILAAITPAVQPALLMVTFVLIKPELLRNRWRYILWIGYALVLLPFVLTTIDMVFGTQIWFTGINPTTYTGGYISIDEFATGIIAVPYKIANFGILSIILGGFALFIWIFDKTASNATRKLARILFAGYVIALFFQFVGRSVLGLPWLLGTFGTVTSTLITSTTLIVIYAYASFQQMISERRLQSGRLQFRLTALTLVITIPPFLAVSYITSLAIQNALEQEAQKQLTTLGQAVATNTSTWLDLNAKALQQLVLLPAITSMDAASQKPYLEVMTKSYPHMYLTSTTDMNGINIARSDNGSLLDYHDRSWFTEASAGAPLALQTLIGRTSLQPSLVAAMPIRNANNEIVGVGMFGSTLTDLAKQIEVSTIGETGYTYIVDTQNKVIAHPDPQVTSELRDITDYPPIQLVRQGQRGIVSFTDEDGITWRAYVNRLDNGWVVIVQQKETEILATVNTLQRISWSVIAAEILLIFGLAWLTIRQAIQPIGSLTKTVTAITEGDLERVAPVESDDEIGVLARSFNSMTSRLRNSLQNLEQQVADRTADLESRSSYLQATAEVGKAIGTILDPNELISNVVETIRQRFDLYYVGLFLVDDTGQWAVLHAGTGAAGQAMLARNHKIMIGAGMVGWSVANGRARIALEAGEDPVRLASTELPDTRSEAALPLRSRNQTLGALTIQSARPNAFNKDNIAVFQILADQVAVAIDNARLFNQTQESIKAMQRAFGELNREAWSKLFRARPEIAFLSNEQGVHSAPDAWFTEMARAWQSGQIVMRDEPGNGANLTLAIPIKVRDTVIGVLDTRKPASSGRWSPEEMALLTTITDQLSVALESARLYEETQRRATREQQVGQITSLMRETLDIDTILKTTVRELGEALENVEVSVSLNLEETPTANQNEPSHGG